ncbi:MAG: class I SAM-dependent methyltransferase [Pseudomonadota bacterium]
METKEEAMAFPRGTIDLMFCDDCGFIFNRSFEVSNVDYAAATEESQHFSGTFSKFAEQLIERISDQYSLQDQSILEVGCGKGDFLLALSEKTGARALGVDPGFLPDRATDRREDVQFRREYFTADTIQDRHDLVVCRHTLEHIPNVLDFMNDIMRAMHHRAGVSIFFETPCAKRVLEERAFWDIYYEHCSYFTEGSHARLFRRTGIGVTDTYRDYGDQYIIQSGEVGRHTPLLDREQDLDQIRAMVPAFRIDIHKQRAHWYDFIVSRAREGKNIALWGGGSKAVSFLTSNGLGDEVSSVVDINPFKQGMYLPGTGHQVVAPTALIENRPDTVVVMNPVYTQEITAQLNTLGLSPDIVALS